MAETASKTTGAPTPVPTNKVISGGISGSVVVIEVWIINTYLLILLGQKVAISGVTVRSTLKSVVLGEAGHERGPAGTVRGL
jgi:hypothetical protein